MLPCPLTMAPRYVDSGTDCKPELGTPYRVASTTIATVPAIT